MKKTQILHNYQANLRKNRREQIKKEHRRKETIVRTDRTERRTDKDITRSEDRTKTNNKSINVLFSKFPNKENTSEKLQKP